MSTVWKLAELAMLGIKIQHNEKQATNEVISELKNNNRMKYKQRMKL